MEKRHYLLMGDVGALVDKYCRYINLYVGHIWLRFIHNSLSLLAPGAQHGQMAFTIMSERCRMMI